MSNKVIFMSNSELLNMILDKAEDVLGSRDKALDWVDHVSTTLGATPRALSATEAGTYRVMVHLGSISRHSFQ